MRQSGAAPGGHDLDKFVAGRRAGARRDAKSDPTSGKSRILYNVRHGSFQARVPIPDARDEVSVHDPVNGGRHVHRRVPKIWVSLHVRVGRGVPPVIQIVARRAYPLPGFFATFQRDQSEEP